MDSSAPQPADQSADCCFYCGLPFEPVSLAADDPLHKKFFYCAKRTTMRFYLPDKLEEENGPQFVAVHSWCNSRARYLSYDERLALKENLTRDVQEQQSPPWQHLQPVLTGKRQKRIQNKQLKQTLSQAGNECFYCSMPFNIVPVKQGGPLHRNLSRWAKKALEVRYIDGEKTAVLVHQWCRSVVGNASEAERLLFKTVLTAHCTGRETLPWIDKKLLEHYEQSGGDALELIKRLDQALLKAGR